MKKLVATVLGVALVASVATSAPWGKKKAKGKTTGGKVLNIAVWNDEFPARFEKYCSAQSDLGLFYKS